MSSHPVSLTTVALALALAAAAGELVAWLSPLAAITLAAGAAVGWSIWLERHPGA